MESYELVEAFAELWDETPKNALQVEELDGITHYLVLLAVAQLRVYVQLSVGVRGGIKEYILVVDPTQEIVADRLVVRCEDGGDVGRGALLPLAELRHRVLGTPQGRRKYALEICREAMEKLVAEHQKRPLDPSTLRDIPSTSESIPLFLTVTGGMPSLGRRGGGAPGSH